MAGIGFSLNRLFQKKGVLNLCRAYAYAGAVAIGPMVMGVCVLLVTNIIHLFASNSGMVGQLADVLLGFCFMMPAVLIYQKVHTRKGALIGMVTGTLCLIVGGVLSNLYILFPLYFGSNYAAGLAKMGFDSVLNCILVAVVPFNIIKGVVVSVVTFVLYKRLSKLLHKLAGKKA